jgi:hypothetical protein
MTGSQAEMGCPSMNLGRSSTTPTRLTLGSDMPDFRDLFTAIGKHPRMYLLEWRYVTLVALVTGCDLATDGALLTGFQEWISERVLGTPESSLYWSTLVASQFEPALLDGAVSEALLSDELSEAACRDLLQQLDEFLSARPVGAGS